MSAFKPWWYGDMQTGERVRMRYINPPLPDEIGRPHLTSTTGCEGVLDRLSMDPIDGYPWNATPHAVSFAVIDDDGFEHRAPINRIIDLHPLAETATVESTNPGGTS